MARAEAAHLFARPDSIQGLAQAIAKPAYRRLLTAEPMLRRAVPILIIAFLTTVGVGAGLQAYSRYQSALSTAVENIETSARLISSRLDRATQDKTAQTRDQVQALLNQTVPPSTVSRYFAVTDQTNVIIAESTQNNPGHLQVADIVSLFQSSALAKQNRTLEATLSDGTPIFARLHALAAPLSQVLIIESRDSALTAWRADTMLTITLSATSGFVLLILGFAFHWQSARAREADTIYDIVRNRFDTALNRGRCGLWDWDLAKGRIFWSRSMFSLLGLQPKDELLTFGTVSALVHPEDIELYQLATQLAEAENAAIDRAFRMRHAQGGWVWLRIRCELVQTDETAPHMIGIAIDITEQKKQLEHANQAKSVFLANMSHELRTPLNAIIGFSEMMGSALFGPLGAEKYHEYCQAIRESGNYLLETINDVLDMSKIEAGQTQLDLKSLELNQVVAESTRKLAKQAQAKALKLAIDIGPLIHLKADHQALQQILCNLLSNAIKFTPEGGRVIIRARQSASHVTIAIEDTGIGIPKEALRNLGLPFQQVESQLTKCHKGAGLGLAIAKSLIELHGGTMQIHSTHGVGTVVQAQLPSRNQAAPAIAPLLAQRGN